MATVCESFSGKNVGKFFVKSMIPANQAWLQIIGVMNVATLLTLDTI